VIKPVGFTAIVLPKEVMKYSKGGIALAVDEVMERNAQVMGTLIEMGEDFAKAYKPGTPQWGLKAGDTVIYAKYAGKWVRDPDTQTEYLIVLDSDIVAKYEPNPDTVVAS
jgi:co-chaperonin GroES (HSP10)